MAVWLGANDTLLGRNWCSRQWLLAPQETQPRCYNTGAFWTPWV